MKPINFTDKEIDYAKKVAKHIYDESRRQGFNPGNAAGNGYEPGHDILGVIGEMAYAKATGIEFVPNINQFKRPDVGDVHVRSSYSLGHLILRPGDVPGPYAFVQVGRNHKWAKVVGHFDGSEAMTDKYWRTKEQVAEVLREGDAAWIVHFKKLKPLQEAA
tara:strand:+ start:64 stop:546 length:483 start_codon:yes stop_codon:yes gene_type:complete